MLSVDQDKNDWTYAVEMATEMRRCESVEWIVVQIRHRPSFWPCGLVSDSESSPTGSFANGGKISVGWQSVLLCFQLLFRLPLPEETKDKSSTAPSQSNKHLVLQRVFIVFRFMLHFRSFRHGMNSRQCLLIAYSEYVPIGSFADGGIKGIGRDKVFLLYFLCFLSSAKRG